MAEAVAAGRRRWLVALAAMAAGIAGARPAARAPDARAPLRIAVLAERVAKLHVQVAQGVLAERAGKELVQAVRAGDELVRGPLPAAPGEARDGHVLLRLLWQQFRAHALKRPSREAVRGLVERAEEVSWVAAKLSGGDGAPSREAARHGARASVLAQRVPRLYLMRRWLPGDAALARDAEAAALELRRTLQALAASAHSAETVAELQVAENQHVFLERAAREIAEGGSSAAAAEVLAKTGDHILESMQRLLRLYGA